MTLGESATSRVGGLASQLFQRARFSPQEPALALRDGDDWITMSAQDFATEVIAAATGLTLRGIIAGDHVAIMSRNRYEWTLLDYALWTVGAVSVPIYDTVAGDHLDWVLHDSGCSSAFVEFDSQAELLQSTTSDNQLRTIWSFESEDLAGMVEQGHAQADDPEVPPAQVGPNSLATLIYTSGTTGRPKGCMITHGNLMYQATTVPATQPELFAEVASTLLFLPLAHVYGRVIQVGAISSGVVLAHSASQDTLLQDLQSFAPTFFPAVPRVFEKIYHGAQREAVRAGKEQRFNAAADAAINYSLRQGNERVGLGLRTRHRVFDRFAYSRLRAAMGNNVHHALSSGSALGARLGHFYRGSGVPILEAYGLTETTGAVAMTSPNHDGIGTVGTPIPGTEVMLDDDGEILVRGPGVFAGYWNNPTATAAALSSDGWLRTGDLGTIDDSGALTITGRGREVIVTAFGQRVAPATLEDRLRSHYLVSQCIVAGDGRPYISCLLTLDPDSVAAWRGEADGAAAADADLSTDPDLRAEIQSAVDEINQGVASQAAIQEFTILLGDWTSEAGLVTPSMKLKRDQVLAAYAAEIDAMYPNSETPT